MVAIVAMMTVSANAQDKWYGSKEGGFALTFNANPVLNYVGNMFNGTQNNSVEDFDGIDGKNLFGGTTITGKYYIKDDLAIDLGFGFNNKYNVENFYDSDDVNKVTSYGRASTTAFHLKAGLEYRLFPGQRLQPLFGADVVYQHTNEWDYATVTEGDGEGEYIYSGNPTNAVGVLLNAGVEYFIIPQISFGANLTFGVAKRWEWKSKDNNPEGEGAYKNYTRIKYKKTNLPTGNVGANVSLNFYF